MSFRNAARFSRRLTRMAGLALFVLAPIAVADELHFALSQTPLALPVFVAEAKGYFAAEGVAFRY